MVLEQQQTDVDLTSFIHTHLRWPNLNSVGLQKRQKQLSTSGTPELLSNNAFATISSVYNPRLIMQSAVTFRKRSKRRSKNFRTLYWNTNLKCYEKSGNRLHKDASLDIAQSLTHCYNLLEADDKMISCEFAKIKRKIAKRKKRIKEELEFFNNVLNTNASTKELGIKNEAVEMNKGELITPTTAEVCKKSPQTGIMPQDDGLPNKERAVDQLTNNIISIQVVSNEDGPYNISGKKEGVSITARTRGSGDCHIETKHPSGFIETFLKCSLSGNLEVVTHIENYNDDSFSSDLVISKSASSNSVDSTILVSQKKSKSKTEVSDQGKILMNFEEDEMTDVYDGVGTALQTLNDNVLYAIANVNENITNILERCNQNIYSAILSVSKNESQDGTKEDNANRINFSTQTIASTSSTHVLRVADVSLQTVNECGHQDDEDQTVPPKCEKLAKPKYTFLDELLPKIIQQFANSENNKTQKRKVNATELIASQDISNHNSDEKHSKEDLIPTSEQTPRISTNLEQTTLSQNSPKKMSSNNLQGLELFHDSLMSHVADCDCFDCTSTKLCKLDNVNRDSYNLMGQRVYEYHSHNMHKHYNDQKLKLNQRQEEIQQACESVQEKMKNLKNSKSSIAITLTGLEQSLNCLITKISDHNRTTNLECHCDMNSSKTKNSFPLRNICNASNRKAFQKPRSTFNFPIKHCSSKYKSDVSKDVKNKSFSKKIASPIVLYSSKRKIEGTSSPKLWSDLTCKGAPLSNRALKKGDGRMKK
ncbi:hypothetical protein FQA39_LY05194 [Lamprigera yunnana]|nr:hypothetical protein FQA39_LY05194 [Lamprigera yunnana]